MLEDYKEKQSEFYNFIISSCKNNKISHAYLIETNNVSYSNDLANDLAKFFLCNNNFNCEGCSNCKNLDIDNYPDVRIIDSDFKMIKKEQVLDLQQAFSVKPIYGKYLIYIIRNANLLNASSSNTLLKFLEEPNDNVIAILLTDHIYNVIDTIISRCQVISLVPDNFTLNSLFKNRIDDATDSNSIISDIVKFYGDFEESGVEVLVTSDYYKFKDIFDIFLNIGLYIYFDDLNCFLNRSMKYFDENDLDIKKIMKNNKISDIIWKIDCINGFIEKSKYNVNKELFMDNYIISLGGK